MIIGTLAVVVRVVGGTSALFWLMSGFLVLHQWLMLPGLFVAVDVRIVFAVCQRCVDATIALVARALTSVDLGNCSGVWRCVELSVA